MTLAATGGTWSVSGQPFLVYFSAALALTIIGTIVHRRIIFAGRRGTSAESLTPQQVAYLAGDNRLAVYAALGGLRAAAAIGVNRKGQLTRAGARPSDPTPLDKAIYRAAGRHLKARVIGKDQEVMAALRHLREGLESSGLAVSTPAAKISRLWDIVGAALTVFALCWFVLTYDEGEPAGFLLVLVGAAFVSFFTLVFYARRSTYTGKKALAELRVRYQHLAPEQSPAYATYGAAEAAMGVALFGAASLYAMDPDFAEQAEVQRHAGSGDGGGSSSPGGDGGGCGGGCGA